MTLFVLLSCKKESASKVDIYMLKSFTTSINRTTSPGAISISNAILADTTLVADSEIESYTQSTTTFKLRKDISSIIRNYSTNKAFAVTVDNKPVYYGLFHPGYLSSITFGLATIDPLNQQLRINFTSNGSSDMLRLDKRNDSRIINSLRKSQRLK
ncbi:MAG TPA: hypothetical protein VF610_06180 [Segetibacter sp.]